MLYKGALHLHDLVWLIVLVSGLWAVFRAWRGKLASAAWTKADRIAGLVFSTALSTQFLIGLVLYSQSPFVRPLFAGGAAGGKRLEAVFFGAIHPALMITAVLLAQLGYSVSKRMQNDAGKFRMAAFCYTAALAIVLLSIPWPFLPYGKGRSLLP